MLEAHKPQHHRVEHGKAQTQCTLPAHESADGIVDLAGKRTHSFTLGGRNPVVDRCNHPVPVVEEIASNYWSYDPSERIEIRALPPDHAERRKVTNQSLTRVVSSPSERSACARPSPMIYSATAGQGQ